MVQDAEVSSGMSFATRSAENFSASVNMTDDAEFGEGDGGDDKTVKRASSKKPNIPMRYLTSLCSGKG